MESQSDPLGLVMRTVVAAPTPTLTWGPLLCQHPHAPLPSPCLQQLDRPTFTVANSQLKSRLHATHQIGTFSPNSCSSGGQGDQVREVEAFCPSHLPLGRGPRAWPSPTGSLSPQVHSPHPPRSCTENPEADAAGGAGAAGGARMWPGEELSF